MTWSEINACTRRGARIDSPPPRVRGLFILILLIHVAFHRDGLAGCTSRRPSGHRYGRLTVGLPFCCRISYLVTEIAPVGDNHTPAGKPDTSASLAGRTRSGLRASPFDAIEWRRTRGGRGRRGSRDVRRHRDTRASRDRQRFGMRMTKGGMPAHVRSCCNDGRTPAGGPRVRHAWARRTRFEMLTACAGARRTCLGSEPPAGSREPPIPWPATDAA